MITIRRLQETDKAEWLRLRWALWSDHNIDDLKQEMKDIEADDEQPIFVAENPEGGLCGLLEVSIRSKAPGCTTNRIGYLEGWYVDKDWRQRGVGRRLVEAAETWARSACCLEMASDTNSDYPVSPVAHAALGYKTTEVYFRKALD